MGRISKIFKCEKSTLKINMYGHLYLHKFLMGIFILLPLIANAQQSPKSIAESEVIQMGMDCKTGGHDFLILYDPIIEIDLGGTIEREVIFDQNALQCDGDSNLFFGSAGPHIDVISSRGRRGYMSQSRPSIVWLDDHWSVRFEMDPTFESEDCAGYCFRYVYAVGEDLVQRYISEW